MREIPRKPGERGGRNFWELTNFIIKTGKPKSGLSRHNIKTKIMALYLTRFSYTPETWARLTKNPVDRREAARKYIESVGGKLHGFWYAFGSYDGYNLWE